MSQCSADLPKGSALCEQSTNVSPSASALGASENASQRLLLAVVRGPFPVRRLIVRSSQNTSIVSPQSISVNVLQSHPQSAIFVTQSWSLGLIFSPAVAISPSSLAHRITSFPFSHSSSFGHVLSLFNTSFVLIRTVGHSILTVVEERFGRSAPVFHN